MKISKQKEDCQHDEYCNFAQNRCSEQAFIDNCKIKSVDITELPLLNVVKERVERDKVRESTLNSSK